MAAPSYSANKHCDKPQRAARHIERKEAPVRKVAEQAPAQRKIKRTPKVYAADEAPATVQTAKLDDKSVTTDAAPGARDLTVLAPIVFDPMAFTSAREGRVIKWADLPPDSDVRLRLGQLMRCAALWRFEGRALLKEKTLLGLNKNWAQKLTGSVNIDDSEDDLNSLDLVLDGLLHWAATIEAMGDTSWVRGPWTLERLRDPGHVATPTEPVKLRARFDSDTFRDAFDLMVRVDSGAIESSRSGATVMEGLAPAKPVTGDHKGIGRAIAALYDAVALR